MTAGTLHYSLSFCNTFVDIRHKIRCRTSVAILRRKETKLATMMVVKETTGAKVKRLREDLSLSQRELAKLAEVSPATILKIEQDTVARPHPRTLRKLAEALEVAPRDLRAD